MIGIGAMLHQLGGGSDENLSDYYGKTISKADINEDRMFIELDGVTIIKIWDNGQSCCESRYITCDDDVSDLVGHKLISIEAKGGGEKGTDYGTHECVFIEVSTDKDSIKFCTHNEHNGYYGGFGLRVTEVDNLQW